MDSREERRGIGIRTWIVFVGFLLIFPPGLPFALSTDRPWLYAFIAVCFAFVAGSAVWGFSYRVSKTQGRPGGGDDRRQSSAHKEIVTGRNVNDIPDSVTRGWYVRRYRDVRRT
jgi:hypothetical protein